VAKIGHASPEHMPPPRAEQFHFNHISIAAALEDSPRAAAECTGVSMCRDGHLAGSTMSFGKIQVKGALLGQSNAAPSHILLFNSRISSSRHGISECLADDFISCAEQAS